MWLCDGSPKEKGGIVQIPPFRLKLTSTQITEKSSYLSARFFLTVANSIACPLPEPSAYPRHPRCRSTLLRQHRGSKSATCRCHRPWPSHDWRRTEPARLQCR